MLGQVVSSQGVLKFCIPSMQAHTWCNSTCPVELLLPLVAQRSMSPTVPVVLDGCCAGQGLSDAL